MLMLISAVQAALDPGVGKGEVRTMEREIHRMRVRLDGLKREQVQSRFNPSRKET